jgi:hypothetical protein
MERSRSKFETAIKSAFQQINHFLEHETMRHIFIKGQSVDIVESLQLEYRGRAVVSRTPGGIVIHRIKS